MYTKYLKSTLVSKGYTTTTIETKSKPTRLTVKYMGNMVAEVSIVREFDVNTSYSAFRQLTPARRLRLYQLLTEYAETPIKERTPETVYAYFLTDVIGGWRYVNYVPSEDAVDINTAENKESSRTHFTDSFIEAHPTLDAWLEKYADVLDTKLIKKGGM